MTAVRVLIVDDQSLMRRGLWKLLELEEGVEVVADAGDGTEALQVLSKVAVNVALVDARMPRMDGVELIARMRQEYPGVPAIVLTTFDDDSYLTGALVAGAKGYLLKDTEPADLVAAIHKVTRGETILGSAAAEGLIAGIRPPAATETSALSEREGEVAALVGAGASNREIARRLYITEGTVKNHVSQVLRKLGLRDRTQLAVHINGNPRD